MIELVNTSREILTDLWNENETHGESKYPQVRMKHLFDMVASNFENWIRTHLSHLDIWRNTGAKVRQVLSASIKVCDAWMKCTSTLVEKFSPRWQGICFLF